MTHEARQGHGRRPVPHLRCDEVQLTAGSPCCSGLQTHSHHHTAPAVTPLSSSLLPTLLQVQNVPRLPQPCLGHAKSIWLLSLSHTFPKGKKIPSLEILFSVHSSSSRKNKPGQDGHEIMSLFRKASLDTQSYQVFYFQVK